MESRVSLHKFERIPPPTKVRGDPAAFVPKDVVVLAATNRPDLVDSSLLRPGRFDRLVRVPLPDKESRVKIFEIHLSRMPLSEDVSILELVKMSKNQTGADIETLCREAGMLALREKILPGIKSEDLDLANIVVEARHFHQASDTVKPYISQDDLKSYQKAMENFGR